MAGVKNNLRVERAKLNIAQKDLANELGVARQTIHSIEHGKFNPSVKLALEIAQFFNVKVDDIFSLESDEVN